jgi:hypothetical protein
LKINSIQLKVLTFDAMDNAVKLVEHESPMKAFVLTETEEGKRHMQTFNEFEKLADADAAAIAYINGLDDQIAAYALVRDGSINVDGRVIDAICVEAGTNGTEYTNILVQKYVAASEFSGMLSQKNVRVEEPFYGKETASRLYRAGSAKTNHPSTSLPADFEIKKNGALYLHAGLNRYLTCAITTNKLTSADGDLAFQNGTSVGGALKINASGVAFKINLVSKLLAKTNIELFIPTEQVISVTYEHLFVAHNVNIETRGGYFRFRCYGAAKLVIDYEKQLSAAVGG